MHALPFIRTLVIGCDSRPMHGAIYDAVERYLAWAAAGRYAESTVRARRGYLRHFAESLRAQHVQSPVGVTAAHLETYRQEITRRCTANGTPIRAGAVTQRLLAVRAFLKWCRCADDLPPAWRRALALPRRGRTLPARVLTARQVERLLALPNPATPLGLRDRAILETLYAGGLRRAEIARLATDDIDDDRCTVWIRRGKNARDRVVPLGPRATAWIQRYRRHARPILAATHPPPFLFLTRCGNPWQPKHLGERVARYLRRAGLGARGACHILRHTMATLMMEHGADLRSLQAILGHARLATTELYTHIGVRHLCAVHARTHPINRIEMAPPGTHRL